MSCGFFSVFFFYSCTTGLIWCEAREAGAPAQENALLNLRFPQAWDSILELLESRAPKKKATAQFIKYINTY